MPEVTGPLFRPDPSLPMPPTPPTAPAAPSLKPGERSFGEILQAQIRAVNDLQQNAEVLGEKALQGLASPEEAMTALRKAELAFQMMQQIRNKLVEAYEELQRMRI